MKIFGIIIKSNAGPFKNIARTFCRTRFQGKHGLRATLLPKYMKIIENHGNHQKTSAGHFKNIARTLCRTRFYGEQGSGTAILTKYMQIVRIMEIIQNPMPGP